MLISWRGPSYSWMVHSDLLWMDNSKYRLSLVNGNCWSIGNHTVNCTAHCIHWCPPIYLQSTNVPLADLFSVPRSFLASSRKVGSGSGELTASAAATLACGVPGLLCQLCMSFVYIWFGRTLHDKNQGLKWLWTGEGKGDGRENWW